MYSEILSAGLPAFLGVSQLLFTAIGVFLGVVIGILPGLGPLLGLTLLTPMAMNMNPFTGMGLLIGIFVGGTAGGAISAILLRIPGTPIAAATLLDGYPLAQKGEAPFAVTLAISTSAIGGIIGGIYLIFFSPLLARVALKFAPPEYFALALTGVVCIAVVSKESTVKGLMVGTLGLLLSTIGMDPFMSNFRFTFGTIALSGGLGIVPMVIGLFAISEMFSQVERGDFDSSPHLKAFFPPIRGISENFRQGFNLFRSSSLGTFIGALPGAGSVIASFVSYAVAKNSSKHPEKFGTGIPDGIIATESANNACCGGTLIPSLTLALPGDPCSAMLLAALMLLGYIPGPRLFVQSQDLVGGIFLAYISSNIFLLFIGLAFLPLFVKLLNVKKKFLIPVILILCAIGAYGMETSINDLWITLIFGVIAFIIQKFNYPLAPFIIANVLGPIMEENFRRSLIMSGDDPYVFITRPIATSILAANIILLFLTVVPLKEILSRKKLITNTIKETKVK
jgi:putative tricarboxylic transport membrane protein